MPLISIYPANPYSISANSRFKRFTGSECAVLAPSGAVDRLAEAEPPRGRLHLEHHLGAAHIPGRCVAQRHADAVMTNLLGDDVNRWAEFLTDPSARLHLYGKTEARKGRKMGHVTRLAPRTDRR